MTNLDNGLSTVVRVNDRGPFVKNRMLLGCQGVVHDISERKKAEIKQEHTRTHDPLTGIYNRVFFEAELKRDYRSR